ncbi:hypothetical protein FTV88_1414 [Heliorestis convoluta]|uniref:Uncharacterized protein n=1 Tax=Heliorestis convoluta TaxID=356322 RepID=A0A5Q2MZT5_9FIRM|nr:hypothetical protein FTV88_1414 [Heliorestis convoluta]
MELIGTQMNGMSFAEGSVNCLEKNLDEEGNRNVESYEEENNK